MALGSSHTDRLGALVVLSVRETEVVPKNLHVVVVYGVKRDEFVSATDAVGAANTIGVVKTI